MHYPPTHAHSYVPNTLHPVVAKQCVAHKVDMVTASYVSPALKVRRRERERERESRYAKHDLYFKENIMS